MNIGNPERTQHIEGLTGLRFFAALAVVLFHALPHWPGPVLDQLWRMTHLGSLGVSLFFVLSGFILFYVYEPAFASGRFSVRPFLVARLARVYPVYLLGLLISLRGFTAVLLPSVAEQGVAAPPLHAAFLAPLVLQAWDPNTACVWNCPGWSLSNEAFFYLLFPVIGAAVARWAARPLGAALALACFAALLPCLVYAWSGYPTSDAGSDNAYLFALWYFPVLRMPEFAIGVLLGRWFLMERPRGTVWFRNLVILASLLALWGIANLPRHIVDVIAQQGLFAPLFGLLIIAVASEPATGRGVLHHPLMVKLGEASYALYIIHMPIRGLFRHLANWGILGNLDEPGVFIAYIAIVIAASLAIYRWFETPARVYLRRRFSGKASPRALRPLAERPVEGIST